MDKAIGRCGAECPTRPKVFCALPYDHQGNHQGFHNSGTQTVWPRTIQAGPDMVPPKQKAEKLLRHTWDQLNKEEVEKVVPKAIEYGSGDLKLMGYAMKMLLNSPRARERDWTEAESQELACAFYILGKVARMISAYERGDLPTDDQPHDIGVYTRMIQILRREGAWPPGFDEFIIKGEK